MNPGPTGRPQSKLMYRLGYGLAVLVAVFFGILIIDGIIKAVEWSLP